jgi:pantoate--beta-alanine ligase
MGYEATEEMDIITDSHEMRTTVNRLKGEGKSVGFVPTMGYFHQGHLALMRAAREENDVVVVSIFVNPLQFGPREDLAAYPRDFERDCRDAREAGVDYVFSPAVEDMYPRPFLTSVVVRGVTEGLCGASRPGHFEGVATVVAKLFHLVPAQRAYFGQKDAQQVRVIRKMVEDLDFGVEIRVCPTVREPDGLAMSSRNTYLEPDQRARAALLYQALKAGAATIEAGERSAAAVEGSMRGVLEKEPSIELEYVGVYDNITLEPLGRLAGEVLLALAARVGKARLIDNMLVILDD